MLIELKDVTVECITKEQYTAKKSNCDRKIFGNNKRFESFYDKKEHAIYVNIDDVYLRINVEKRLGRGEFHFMERSEKINKDGKCYSEINAYVFDYYAYILTYEKLHTKEVFEIRKR